MSVGIFLNQAAVIRLENIKASFLISSQANLIYGAVCFSDPALATQCNQHPSRIRGWSALGVISNTSLPVCLGALIFVSKEKNKDTFLHPRLQKIHSILQCHMLSQRLCSALCFNNLMLSSVAGWISLMNSNQTVKLLRNSRVIFCLILKTPQSRDKAAYRTSSATPPTHWALLHTWMHAFAKTLSHTPNTHILWDPALHLKFMFPTEAVNCSWLRLKLILWSQTPWGTGLEKKKKR